MKQVIRIGEEPKEEKVLKPIEFTHNLSIGWEKTYGKGLEYYRIKKVIYLGKCMADGDMFSTYDTNGNIRIFKGHLNDGVY